MSSTPNISTLSSTINSTPNEPTPSSNTNSPDNIHISQLPTSSQPSSSNDQPQNSPTLVQSQPSHNMTTRLQRGISKPINKLNLNVEHAEVALHKNITQAVKSQV